MIRPSMTRCLTTVMAMAIALPLATGCDKSSEKAPPAAKPVASESAPVPKPEPVEPPAPALEEPALTKKRLDELNTFDWMDILKAAGWTNASSGGMAMGAWAQTTITAKQGDKQATVTLVAPTGAADDPGASVKSRSPAEQLERWKQKGAAELLRENFLVAVSIEGDPEGAQKLLAHIKDWVIVK